MERTLTIDLGDVTLSVLTYGRGPLVLCAHGFPDGPNSFRKQVGPLVEAGFQVAAPAMRGYAPSSLSRSGQYDPVALARDLCALADSLSPGAPVRLIGHDWGAIGAYAATAMAPARFSHLVTIAVPHLRTTLKALATPRQMRRSWYVGLFQLPGMAERRLAENHLALVDRLWCDWSPGYRPDPEQMARVKEGIAPRIGPVIAYYRAMFSLKTALGQATKLMLARTSVRTLYLHGVEDGCVGVECIEGMKANFTREVLIHRIAGAGHFVHLERPEVVNPLLLAFLGQPGG